MQRRTIRDVAERAGVSLGTVSNVLNRPELVASATRERVLQAIADVNFVRNSAARQLRGGRGQAVGLVTFEFDNPFFGEVARGVEAAADEAGLLVILCSSAGSPEREERQLGLLEEQRVTGILVTSIGRKPSTRVSEVHARGTPVVLLDRHRSARHWCSASIDDTLGARLVAEHLIELGHRRIGLVNGPTTLTPCVERRESLIAVLHEHGLELDPAYDVEVPEMTIAAGERGVSEMLDRAKPPTAVFCTNDLLALGAERGALARGVAIPGDLALVGYDDISFAASGLVPLTTVRNPSFELGFEGTRLLLEEARAGTNHKHRQLRFQPTLVVRGSTARLRASRARQRARG